MLEALKEVSPFGWATIVAGALTIIQISPIKIDPWSWIAKKIGNALNQDVIKKQEEIQEESKTYRQKNDKRIQSIVDAIGRNSAEDARNRILRFGDEIKSKQIRHSEEYYNQILADMTEYEKYCHEHPLFKNERTVATEKVIRSSYEEHLKNNDFL